MILKADPSVETQPSETEMNNAEFISLGIACDLDKIVGDSPELAVIYANSAIAAAKLICSRHGVSETNRRELWDQFWAEMVERNTEH